MSTFFLRFKIFNYSNNYITKKEPKSDNRLTKFEWDTVGQIGQKCKETLNLM